MRAFPLVRIRFSNEHIMTALFFVLILYLVPGWIKSPVDITWFVITMVFGLLIDVLANIIRYKKPVCAVSSVVTAGILQVLTPGIPVWGRLLGIAAALVIGKHIWGGTEKNVLNPAITGWLILNFIFRLDIPEFPVSLLLIPAAVFSVPFILFRPFAGFGMISGMALGLAMGGGITAWSIAMNCIFFGCLILTDPVTSSPRPSIGLIGGILAGFLPYFIQNPAYAYALAILAFNLVSYITAGYSYKRLPLKFKIGEAVPASETQMPPVDVSGEGEEAKIFAVTSDAELTPEMILNRIETNEVFGCGGAAFPTIEKIKAVLASDAKEKYFIINGVECDPGLIHDKWLVRNRSKEIYKGFKAICSCIPFTNAFLAVKKAEGLDYPSGLKVFNVRDFYPAGAERILIESVLGKMLPEGIIPAKAGILVLNVQTVYAVYQAVYLNKKCDKKYITVSDMVNKQSRIAKVRMGTKIHDVMEAVFPRNALVFSGGGLMQSRMADDGDNVQNNTNFIAAAKLPNYKESPLCSKCGVCSTVCPAGLEGGKIAELVDSGKIKETAKHHPERCIGCGSCSYVCLAGKNLSARVMEAKEANKSS